MKCARCETERQAEYRVFSDIMDIKVCADCAAEARSLHLGIELFEDGKTSQAEEYILRAS